MHANMASIRPYSYTVPIHITWSPPERCPCPNTAYAQKRRSIRLEAIVIKKSDHTGFHIYIYFLNIIFIIGDPKNEFHLLWVMPEIVELDFWGDGWSGCLCERFSVPRRNRHRNPKPPSRRTIPPGLEVGFGDPGSTATRLRSSYQGLGTELREAARTRLAGAQGIPSRGRRLGRVIPQVKFCRFHPNHVFRKHVRPSRRKRTRPTM